MKRKPVPPVKPEKPGRRMVGRTKTLSGHDKQSWLQQIQALPDDATISTSSGCCCYNDCSDSEVFASWMELETEQEYAQQLKYHESRLKEYNKQYALYEKTLQKWNQWYEENKATIEAQEKKNKVAELAQLNKLLKDTQKRIENLSESEEVS